MTVLSRACKQVELERQTPPISLTTLIRGQLLGITHRTVLVNFSHFKQRFSPRKLIPVNVKTLGDYLLLKRIEADLSQPELAVKSGATVRKVKAWEHDQNLPTEVEWKLLVKILKLKTATRPALPKFPAEEMGIVRRRWTRRFF